jgi:hypothetical protein
MTICEQVHNACLNIGATIQQLLEQVAYPQLIHRLAAYEIGSRPFDMLRLVSQLLTSVGGGYPPR